MEPHRQKKEKKKDEFIFVFSMYICVMMTFADVFVGSVSVVYSPCHTFMTSKKTKQKQRCHHVAFYHLSISFCKVYILIMVMILSRADSSLSVSVCHSRNSVFEFVST